MQMIILDACRNDPFPRKDYWLRDQLIVAGDSGLAQVTGVAEHADCLCDRARCGSL
ncbi:hypothetical protein ACVOMV_04090 [Mesorhizobium atlanticum]